MIFFSLTRRMWSGKGKPPSWMSSNHNHNNNIFRHPVVEEEPRSSSFLFLFCCFVHSSISLRFFYIRVRKEKKREGRSRRYFPRIFRNYLPFLYECLFFVSILSDEREKDRKKERRFFGKDTYKHSGNNN